MRRTVRGRGARGFHEGEHAFREFYATWLDLDGAHEPFIVGTAECACGKRDVRVTEWVSWPGREPLPMGNEPLRFMRPVDFSECRKLPALLCMRGGA